MQWIYFSVFVLTALLGIQAQNETPAEESTASGSNGAVLPANSELPTDSTGTNTNNAKTSANEAQDSTSPQRDQYIMTKPDGAGIHAGFQAAGSNFATTLSGGLKSQDGATLETGLNFAGRFGDTGLARIPSLGIRADPVGISPLQYGRNTQQQSSAAQQPYARSDAQNFQGSSRPELEEGATFAVSYKPGLLSAVGNMLNPFRMFQQLGDAFAGMTGFGQAQGNPMVQMQPQFSPPQASRTNSNNNGVGITWKPLYRAFW